VPIGAILRFADSSDLSGNFLAWIIPLKDLSEGFTYPLGHPLHAIMDDLSPFELAKIVDGAIRKHHKDIRNLKKIQLACQALEVWCMVEQAHLAGARGIFAEGEKLQKVTPEEIQEYRSQFAKRWEEIWRVAAHGAYDLLVRIDQHVRLKGKKARPATLADIASVRALVDEGILLNIHRRKPNTIPDRSIAYVEYMREGIVPEVKEAIRTGLLSGGRDPGNIQHHVDVHARRLRKRLEKHLASKK